MLININKEQTFCSLPKRYNKIQVKLEKVQYRRIFRYTYMQSTSFHLSNFRESHDRNRRQYSASTVHPREQRHEETKKSTKVNIPRAEYCRRTSHVQPSKSSLTAELSQVSISYSILSSLCSC